MIIDVNGCQLFCETRGGGDARAGEEKKFATDLHHVASRLAELAG